MRVVVKEQRRKTQRLDARREQPQLAKGAVSWRNLVGGDSGDDDDSSGGPGPGGPPGRRGRRAALRPSASSRTRSAGSRTTSRRRSTAKAGGVAQGPRRRAQRLEQPARAHQVDDRDARRGRDAAREALQIFDSPRPSAQADRERRRRRSSSIPARRRCPGARRGRQEQGAAQEGDQAAGDVVGRRDAPRRRHLRGALPRRGRTRRRGGRPAGERRRQTARSRSPSSRATASSASTASRASRSSTCVASRGCARARRPAASTRA